MTNLSSILKSRDITLLTKVRLVKSMVFLVVMYGCESWTIKKAAAATAKSLQSCLTLCDPIDSSPPGSLIPGILQARTLEWVAISFSNACKWKVKVKSLSRVRLLATHGLQPTRLLRPWDFPGKSTGVECHCLLRNVILLIHKKEWKNAIFSNMGKSREYHTK